MRRGNDLVAGLNPQRRHCKIERVGAVGAGYAMLDVHGACKFPLEGIDVRSTNERAVANHRCDRGIDLAFDGLILKLQIGKWHRHRLSAPQFEQTRRISGVGPSGCDVFRHHRPRADDDVVSDVYRQDGGVGTDRNPVADHGWPPQLLAPASRSAGRKRIVDEHHAMADKTVLADRYEFADESMRLHPGAGADDCALLDLRERPDQAIIADPAAVDIARLDDPDPGAELDVAHTGVMHEGFAHGTTPRRLRRGAKRSGTSSPVSIDS